MGKTILSRCCCFDNVRSGSMASAIYTLIYAALTVGYGGWQVNLVASNLAVSISVNNAVATSVYYGMIFGLIVWSLVFIASFFVLFGLSADNRFLLIPYMIAMPMVVLLQVACGIIYIWIMTILSGYAITGYIIVLLVLVAFTILDVFCLLTVVSQYQEYQAGRGRLEDIIAARASRLTMIATTSHVGGATLVTHQAGAVVAPPPPGYSIQQPGYPAQQPGYPAQQPGYPAQQPGYPAQQPGYPTQQDNPQKGYAPLHNEQA